MRSGNPRRRCPPPPPPSPPPGSARRGGKVWGRGQVTMGWVVGGRGTISTISIHSSSQRQPEAGNQAGSSALCPERAGRVTLAHSLGWGHAGAGAGGGGSAQEAALSVTVGFGVGRTDRVLHERECVVVEVSGLALTRVCVLVGLGLGDGEEGPMALGAAAMGLCLIGSPQKMEPAAERQREGVPGSDSSFLLDNWTRVICGEAQVPFSETAAPLARRAEDLTPKKPCAAAQAWL